LILVPQVVVNVYRLIGRFISSDSDPDRPRNHRAGTCTINISRSASSANVKPDIPNAKNNQLFCIMAGTTVVWMSSNKNHGFTVSFGTDSPFNPDAPIMGGGKKQVTTKAMTPGCYKYDVGVFRSGTVYGMSGGSRPELVILP
jgi:hypothetical protein